MTDELLEGGINKEEIVKNISEIFIRYGIRSSSMDDIARYLKMSKKTLYGIFENKNNVVDQVIQYRKSVKDIYLDRLNMATIEPIPYLYRHVNDAMERFSSQAVPNNLFDVKKYHPELYRKHFQEVSQKSIQAMCSFFEKGIVDGVFRKEINKELQAYLFSMQFLSLADSEVSNSGFEVKEVITAIIENFIRSIATSKGVAQLEDLIQKNK
jgi:AcrR family transcriptional regulator